MQTYDFKLILDRVDLDEEEADALYGRCKDATLITEEGVTFLDFDRRADSLEQAVRSAIADVNAAGFRVLRVEIEADTFAAQTV